MKSFDPSLPRLHWSGMVTFAVVVPFNLTQGFAMVQIMLRGAAQVSATVPLKPFTDPKLRVAVPVLPGWIARFGVSVEKAKSVGLSYIVVAALADPA